MKKKKKIIVYLSICLSICLSIFCLNCYADELLSVKIYNWDFLDDYYSDHTNAQYLFNWDYQQNYIESAQNAIEQFHDQFPNINNYLGVYYWNTKSIVFYSSESSINYIFGGEVFYSSNEIPGYYSSLSDINISVYGYNNDVFGNPSTWTTNDSNNIKWQFDRETYYVFTYSGDVHFYSLDDIYDTGALSSYLNGYEIVNSTDVGNIFTNVLKNYDYSTLYDYAKTDLPYFDGNEVVYPHETESNTNHLYLTGCDAGFTKPLSLNNLNSSGGGYVYFTYNFDDWINNHSGDYTLQCNSTFYINNSSTGSIVRRNLDVSGVSIFALSELGDFVDWQNLNTTFMGYPNQILTGNYIKGYVYSLTYNQFGILQERYAKAGAHTVGYWVVKFANMLPGVKITENNVNYQEYFNSVVPSRFDLKVSFKIIDNVSGEQSGTYTKTFNMLTGVSNVDSNSIQDNENPYVPSDSDDLQLPSIGDGNNGYLIETGDNNQIVNLTTPDNIKLFIDNGFQNFLSWYETSADTTYATNRFWSSMGIFEDNPASELYSEYFGFLPDDFKTLIFSCAGIGIVGGAFCILRRRLH